MAVAIRASTKEIVMNNSKLFSLNPRHFLAAVAVALTAACASTSGSVPTSPLGEVNHTGGSPTGEVAQSEASQQTVERAPAIYRPHGRRDE
jgi:hypothetical protein